MSTGKAYGVKAWESPMSGRGRYNRKTLCDPIWQVISRVHVMRYTNRKLTGRIYFTYLVRVNSRYGFAMMTAPVLRIAGGGGSIPSSCLQTLILWVKIGFKFQSVNFFHHSMTNVRRLVAWQTACPVNTWTLTPSSSFGLIPAVDSTRPINIIIIFVGIDGVRGAPSIPWPWLWFIPYPTGHIGPPHSDAIRVCQELPPLLPPRWTPYFVGLCWPRPSSSLLVDLVLSCILVPVSTVLAVVCAGGPYGRHVQASEVVFLSVCCPWFVVQFWLW